MMTFFLTNVFFLTLDPFRISRALRYAPALCIESKRTRIADSRSISNR
jgi:hypothetical protein